jgi:adenosine 3'-phospho 5'-phosphosulfate transporter B3
MDHHSKVTSDDVERVPLFLEEEGNDTISTSTTTSADTYARTIFNDGEATQLQVISYMLVFFAAMVGHELALEAATTEFSFVDSIAYSVTLFQFGFCLLLPLLVTQGNALKRFPRSPREALPYVKLSLVVFGATALASQSLKWVTYPTKVVFKSTKLIPTMMVATIMQGKRYGWLDYLAALLLCVGAAGYAMDSSVSHGPVNNAVPGLVLLIISILCDALVPNLQQQFMTPPDALSATELMVNVNAVGFSGLLVYMLAMGQLMEGIRTCLEFPRLMVYLTLVGLGLSTAVLAYTRLIQTSGSVAAVAVATLRKVATIVLSYIVFPKPLLAMHIAAGLAVLAGVLLSTVKKCENGTGKVR